MAAPSRLIVVRFHENIHAEVAERFAGEADDLSFITAPDKQRPADLILSIPTSIDQPVVRAIVRQHHPIPVFVVLDASKRQAHISQCLQAGAIQCLIDPTSRVLTAHIRATVRRFRAHQ